MAVTGEMVPAMDAVRINHLAAYQQLYPDFPAVLKETRWISALEDVQSCGESPRGVWNFSEEVSPEDVGIGRVCTRKKTETGFEYSCEKTGFLGRKTTQTFSVAFGDPILPDWVLDRPHITLERKGWRKLTIGLQMCSE